VDFLAFLSVSTVVIVTPGQDTALTIRNVLAAGGRSGLFTAAGVAAGQATWAVASAVGIAALLRASEPVFLAVKLCGAAYLVLLGLQTLAAALRRRQTPALLHPVRVTAGGSFRQGLFSNLGNPKMAVFFTSLLPQFGHASFVALLSLGLVFSLMTLVWLSVYSVALARMRDVLLRPSVRRVIDAVTGGVLVAFGLRIATESQR
jgi:threonine/homoserine/homoserine lactone efflux protein